jgi:broad specificity phosphatase PhoE
MAEVILVRHGETEWNVAEVFRGRIDIGLNETGLEQAELLAKCLRDIRIDAIYSSPLKRALKTAERIAGYHELNVETTPALVDFDYGEWQGLSRQEVKDRYKELYAQWLNHPGQVKIPAGESLDDVRRRVTSVIDKVIAAKYEGSVVLVSHRVVNKVLICALLGLDNSHFWNIRQDTGGMTNFTYQKERFILTRHNDTSYLRPFSKAPLTDF